MEFSVRLTAVSSQVEAEIIRLTLRADRSSAPSGRQTFLSDRVAALADGGRYS